MFLTLYSELFVLLFGWVNGMRNLVLMKTLAAQITAFDIQLLYITKKQNLLVLTMDWKSNMLCTYLNN